MRGAGVVAAAALAVAVGTSGVAGAAEPTFKNGLAQAVFTTDTSKWISYDGWVQSNSDSDHDGKLDRIHFDVTRPPETDQGLKVPVVMEASPYYSALGPNSNWPVDVEIGAQPPQRPFQPDFTTRNTSPQISTSYESTWVPRGFAVMHVEAPGTGWSEGCPTDGAPNENDAIKSVVDWINGRAPGFTTRDGGTPLTAGGWATGKVGMIGASYNGSLQIAGAVTGVQGLDAIVPISPVSDYYEYYRANGMVRGPGGWQGEDSDVLADVVYTRQDETYPRMKCRSLIEQIGRDEDRVTGDRNAFWDERNLNARVPDMHAAVLLVHGNNDNNVMTKNATAFYDAVKKQGLPHEFLFHQGGHGTAPPDVFVNRWFSHFLYGQQNGAEDQPHSWVVRSETNACPPRQSTVTGDQSNTATLTVADTSPFPLGFTLTVPQTNAGGTITNTTRVITDIPDSTHLVLASAVATTAGQKVADGAVVSLVCGTANPTPYSEWPDPAAKPVTQRLTAGSPGRGTLGFTTSTAAGTTETLTDNAAITATTSMNTASSGTRLVYQMAPLSKPVRISGTPWLNLRMAFSKPKANLTGILISYPAAGGNGTILSRGWLDPENRDSDRVSKPIVPGTFYEVRFDLQPKDMVIPAGRRLAVMILSSDNEHTLRPAPGTQLTLDTAASSVQLPIVGGGNALSDADGDPYHETSADGGVGGTVPATLSLALGGAASFGAFTPGLDKEYTASTTANVISTAGNATLSVSDPGHLTNGSFSLPEALRVDIAPASWTGPVSNAAVAIAFHQHIGANDALRTGAYSKTLTFTLSTTAP
jgi:predicted acyl esterase